MAVGHRGAITIREFQLACAKRGITLDEEQVQTLFDLNTDAPSATMGYAHVRTLSLPPLPSSPSLHIATLYS